MTALTDTAPALDVFVPGRPAPQGSKRARPIYRGRGETREFTGKVAVVEQLHDAVKDWRADVRATVAGQLGTAPVAGAVILRLEFVLPRPKATPKRKPTPHATKRPDLDKLTRCTADALTSCGAYVDDAQVVQLVASKRLAEPGEATGCRITLVEVSA